VIAMYHSYCKWLRPGLTRWCIKFDWPFRFRYSTR